MCYNAPKKSEKCVKLRLIFQKDVLYYIRYLKKDGEYHEAQRNSVSYQMEIQRRQEAIGYKGSSTGRKNMADEGVRKKLL